jgi:hypothetical protein
MDKGKLEIDPRGLIFESYRIDGIRIEECRSIFLDWAMGLAADTDMQAALSLLQQTYAQANPGHPMNSVIAAGLDRQAAASGRRGGRRRGGADGFA